MKEVDIYVAEVSKTYSFSIDENVPMNVLAEEICAMAAQKEQIDVSGDVSSLLFYDMAKLQILSGSATPSELGIHNGDKLWLI